MKINETLHGILDYVLVIFLVLSPTLFPLSPMVATFTYVLAGVHLILTILTDFKPGIVKLIPFRIHGIIEFVVAVALFGLAFYFGNVGTAADQYFYMSFAIAILLVWLLTNYRRI